MRKITEQAAAAFELGYNFKLNNTEVRKTAGSVQMLLHGNLIAERTEAKLYINSCGWMTPTTKERLNGIDGVNVSQRKGEWFLNGDEWNGTLIEVKV